MCVWWDLPCFTRQLVVMHFLALPFLRVVVLWAVWPDPSAIGAAEGKLVHVSRFDRQILVLG